MVLILWLLLVLSAFYFFFLRFIQPFDRQNLYPLGQVNQLALTGFIHQYLQPSPLHRDDIIIYHWLNPDCRCTVLGGNYIARLAQQGVWQKVSHIIVVPADKARRLLDQLPMLSGLSVMALDEQAYQASVRLMPSAPAAMVYYHHSVSYFGPHSGGVLCGSGLSYVELVINNLQNGFDPALSQLDQQGCFCDW
ncbi:MAG: hypothetical protein ACI8WB_001539 [Phenylobacterium sp.]|jgi:hypothetical protein